MKLVLLIGRLLYAFMFIHASVGHFSAATIGYAAGKGVPLASIMVPLSGFMALLGGLSIALGFKAKWGAWLIVLFLVPVTVMMHNFWTVSDPDMRQMQQIMFMKNLSMLGGALILTYFGSGPLSLDNRKRNEAGKAADNCFPVAECLTKTDRSCCTPSLLFSHSLQSWASLYYRLYCTARKHLQV